MSTSQIEMTMTNTIRRAVLDRYLSNPTDEAWEQLKYDLYREAQAHGAQGGFPITSVSRDDLESQGFDASNVTDEQMADIASKMEEAYTCGDTFWIDLDILARDVGVPRKAEG